MLLFSILHAKHASILTPCFIMTDAMKVETVRKAAFITTTLRTSGVVFWTKELIILLYKQLGNVYQSKNSFPKEILHFICLTCLFCLVFWSCVPVQRQKEEK